MSPAADDDAENRIKLVFASVFELSFDDIGPEMSPESVDEWDSFGHMRLITAIEKEFELTLTMEQISAIEDFATLRSSVLDAL